MRARHGAGRDGEGRRSVAVVRRGRPRRRRDGHLPGAPGAAGVLAAVVVLALGAPSASGQVEGVPEGTLTPARPLPGPVVPPPFYRRAVEAGTRSADGSPGPRYWRQSARYDIRASLEPGTGRVEGSETVVYRNASPDTLPVLVLHLHQNLHAEGVVRNEAQEVTGGVELQRVEVQGARLQEGILARGPAWVVEGTILVIRPPRPVLPGDSVELAIDFAFSVPGAGAGRMGHSDRELYFLAYWFPKVAVYDDLRGWDAQPYLGSAEFYDEFGDYRVELTVPAGWTVMATGHLENAAEVYPPEILSRVEAAVAADTTVAIVSDEDRGDGRATAGSEGRTLTYRFASEEVRDFTWTASNAQVWIGTGAEVPDRDGDGAADRVAIHAFYRPERAPLWAEQARFAKHAIEHHSRYTGFAYPWPHMTSVEGSDIIGGGMEFPMLTLIGPYSEQGLDALYNVTSHELAHMWIPMIVGTNEKRYAWMDEGFTSFLENQGRPEFRPGEPADSLEAANYLPVARAEMEEPLLTHGDYYEPGPAYGSASYAKSATLLVALRGLLGEETFDTAYRTYVDEWAWKHPAPWDFFNTVERFADRDLDWFWASWYGETWRLDHAVSEVRPSDGGAVVVVEDRGRAPMPARLQVETTDGDTLRAVVPVTTWLEGETRAEVTLDVAAERIRRIVLDPEGVFPDVDRTNDVWTPDGRRPRTETGSPP